MTLILTLTFGLVVFVLNVSIIEWFCSGLEDRNDQGGPLNVGRFSWVDPSVTDYSVLNVAGEFPWAENQPNDNGGNQNAVE